MVCWFVVTYTVGLSPCDYSYCRRAISGGMGHSLPHIDLHQSCSTYTEVIGTAACYSPLHPVPLYGQSAGSVGTAAAAARSVCTYRRRLSDPVPVSPTDSGDGLSSSAGPGSGSEWSRPSSTADAVRTTVQLVSKERMHYMRYTKLERLAD